MTKVAAPPTIIANTGLGIPSLVASTGPDGVRRFVEFFAANIRNANTREAYARAVVQRTDSGRRQRA